MHWSGVNRIFCFYGSNYFRNVSEAMQYSSFCDWFISCFKMTSRLTYVAAYDKISFFLMAEWCPIIYMSHFLYTFNYCWTLDCSHLLSTKNITAMNIGMQISLRGLDCNSFGCISRNEITGSYGSPSFNFLRNCHTALSY